MPQHELKTFMVEDAKIFYRNFEGRETRFKPAGGDGTFCVALDPPLAEKMLRDGWDVKYPEPKDLGDGEEIVTEPFIRVTVGYKFRPPLVVMITSAGRTNLTEDTIKVLDWADIKTVDLIARQGYWEVAGKTGYKAWLKSMFVTIEEDDLEKKYGIYGGEQEPANG